MSKAVGRFREQGIATALFGDIYLDDLRRQREAGCGINGVKAAFPLCMLCHRMPSMNL